MSKPSFSLKMHPATREAAEVLIDQINETHRVLDIHGSAVHGELAVILEPAPCEFGRLPSRGRVTVYVPWPGLKLRDLQAYRASWGLSPEVSVWSRRWHTGPFPTLGRDAGRLFRRAYEEGASARRALLTLATSAAFAGLRQTQHEDWCARRMRHPPVVVLKQAHIKWLGAATHHRRARCWGVAIYATDGQGCSISLGIWTDIEGSVWTGATYDPNVAPRRDGLVDRLEKRVREAAERLK